MRCARVQRCRPVSSPISARHEAWRFGMLIACPRFTGDRAKRPSTRLSSPKRWLGCDPRRSRRTRNPSWFHLLRPATQAGPTMRSSGKCAVGEEKHLWQKGQQSSSRTTVAVRRSGHQIKTYTSEMCRQRAGNLLRRLHSLALPRAGRVAEPPGCRWCTAAEEGLQGVYVPAPAPRSLRRTTDARCAPTQRGYPCRVPVVLPAPRVSPPPVNPNAPFSQTGPCPGSGPARAPAQIRPLQGPWPRNARTAIDR